MVRLYTRWFIYFFITTLMNIVMLWMSDLAKSQLHIFSLQSYLSMFSSNWEKKFFTAIKFQSSRWMLIWYKGMRIHITANGLHWFFEKTAESCGRQKCREKIIKKEISRKKSFPIYAQNPSHRMNMGLYIHIHKKGTLWKHSTSQ